MGQQLDIQRASRLSYMGAPAYMTDLSQVPGLKAWVAILLLSHGIVVRLRY